MMMAPFRGLPLRIEDWLLVGWVALVAPLLARLQPAAGPFDAGQPVQGAVRLVAVLGAIACLAARVPRGTSAGPGLLDRAAIGPFVGGLLLVAISGAGALALPSWGPYVLVAIALAVGLVMRIVVPPLGPAMRRALVAPFVLVTGGLFWSVIDAVMGPSSSGLPSPAALLAAPNRPLLGFLVVFSAVYYAMLVFAPRQVAEREGGPITWVVRYAAFLAGVLLGVGWLGAFGA
jgi:hypothetical protein